MGYPDFVDRVLYDYMIFCEDRPAERFQGQLEEVEQDEDLSPDERRDAILCLRLANLIDPSREQQMEEICRDLHELRHPGFRYTKITLSDHGNLGEPGWEALDLIDDAGNPCQVHYNRFGEPDPYVFITAYMKAVEQETAEFLLRARVEGLLDSFPVAA